MNNKIFSVLSTYVNWLAVNYQAISKVNSAIPALRLISHQEDSKTGDIQFVTQVSGKNIFPTLLIKDFIKDQSILNCFSKSDQEIICHYLPEYQAAATHSIVARTYDRTKKQFIFTIEYFDQHNLKKRISVNDIFRLSKHIHLFNREDAFLIGLEASKVLK